MYPIPEVDFDGGYLKNLEIHLPQPPLSDININMEHATNGVELSAQGVSATISSDFSYKYFITVTGEIAIDVKKLGLDLEIDLDTQPGTPSWETAPKLRRPESCSGAWRASSHGAHSHYHEV